MELSGLEFVKWRYRQLEKTKRQLKRREREVETLIQKLSKEDFEAFTLYIGKQNTIKEIKQ